MGYPSGSIYHATRSGRLQVIFSGRFLVDGESVAGPSDADLLLQCRVGSGAAQRLARLSTRAGSATIEVDYTAGTTVEVAIEHESHDIGSAESIGAVDLSISCHIIPSDNKIPLVSFAGLLQQAMDERQQMSESAQTPRWLPDTDGDEWFVRRLSDMATHHASANRFLSAADSGEGGVVNHPVAGARSPNPINPDTVVATGYPNKTWSGTGTPCKTQVLTATEGGQKVYYIRVTEGPVNGTVTISWDYADLTELDGSSLSTAWPGLTAVNQSVIQPSDTLWVCGTHENQTLTLTRSGTAGAYIKVRLDHPTYPGRIDQGARITTPWTASGNEWWTPMPNVSTCSVYVDGERLYGVNTKSRCRQQVSAINSAENKLTFSSMRHIQTGDPIDIASDFVWAESLPDGLTPNTRYYAVVVSSAWPGFYPITQPQYVVQLAASYANAVAVPPVVVDFTAKTNPNNRPFLLFVRQFSAPINDPQAGSLQPGQYAMDVVQQRLYVRLEDGSDPNSHVMRIAAETTATTGACIYGNAVSHIRVLGGGEYGGIFGVEPAGVCGKGEQNIIEFDNSSDIVIDGMELSGGRSGVTFVNVARATVRNCLIDDLTHHACGGESLAGSQEQELILERNWIRHVGDTHHVYGDVQALVTNNDCHRSIFRRNLVQDCGANRDAIDPSVCVFDGNHGTKIYWNWIDNCFGRAHQAAAGVSLGVPDGAVDGVWAMNVVTRQGRGIDPATNLASRNGVISVALNGQLDAGVTDMRAWGNLIAWTTIGDVDSDPQGLVYQRNVNNNGAGENVLAFTRNAVLSVDGPVYSAQKLSTAARWPTLNTNNNLYAAVPEFAMESTNSGAVVATWDALHVQGTVAGFWSADRFGRDSSSRFVVLDTTEAPRGPTTEELEFLRLHDEYDTYDTYEDLSMSLAGNFPFA